MLKSIRSVLYMSFVIVGISLFFVVLLGVRQFQLIGQYSDITALSERTLFAFSTIREQVTESLITRNYQPLKDVVPEIEILNNNISRLYESDIIPGNYKLAMTDKIDLKGLALTLRKLASGDEGNQTSLLLQQELRHIADNLIKVDRIISRQIRNSVVNYQLGVIGAMGLLISCTSFMLIALHRKAIKPLLELSFQVKQINVGEDYLTCQTGAGSEIVELAESMNNIMENVSANGDYVSNDPGEEKQLSKTINETTNGLNGMINYAQLLLESESQLSSDQRKMLEQIINTGERVAEQWQKTNQRFAG